MEASKEKIERKDECIDIKKREVWKEEMYQMEGVEVKNQGGVSRSKEGLEGGHLVEVSKGTSRGEIKGGCRRGGAVEGIE